MNHTRQRYALAILLKKLKFSPVVLIQGPRQTGKSFLVKKLIPEKIQTVYKTLDLASTKNFATENPDTFVRDIEPDQILIIDEAQKSPAIFDSVKAAVDEQRRPGQYILLGSTEFSKLTNIRESLTGRASRLKIFPLTLSESKYLPSNTNVDFINSSPRVSRPDLMKYLKNGGMPGIFGIKNDNEKLNALKDWIDLTAQRDALNFKNVKIDSELILRILSSVADLDDASASSFSKHLRTDLRKINTHLNILTTLFVLNKIEPYASSTGKAQYYFCDVGFLNYYDAAFDKKIRTWVAQELVAQISYSAQDHKKIYYYRSSKGKILDFVICNKENVETCIKIIPDEMSQSKQYELLRSFKIKNSDYFTKNTKLVVLSGTLQKMKDDDIHIHPWESIA
jgi:uncharacterized protein